MDLSNGKSLQNNNLHNNKYHFLFSFLYWSLIQIQSRIASSSPGFQYSGTAYTGSHPFPALSWAGYQKLGLSVARWDRCTGGRSGCGFVALCPTVLSVAQWVRWSSALCVPVAPVPTVVQCSGGTVSQPSPGHQVFGESGLTQPCPTGVCRVWVSGRGQDCSAVASCPPPAESQSGPPKINKNR